MGNATVAWPFFVTKNKYVEYTTVMSPRFLIENDDHRKLATSWTGGPPTQSGHAYKTALRDPKYGKLILIYWITTVQPGENGDRYGREIRWIEGLIIRDSLGFDDKIPISIQDEIGKRCRAAYVHFRDNEYPEVQVSDGLVIPSTTASGVLIELTQYQPYCVAETDNDREQASRLEHDERTAVAGYSSCDIAKHLLKFGGAFLLFFLYLLYKLTRK